MSAVLTGATVPAAIIRRVASPDAETPSYCPVAISDTMLGESRPSVVWTLQPVLSSNGVTQSNSAPFSPRSAYPTQITRFRSLSAAGSSVSAPDAALVPQAAANRPQPARIAGMRSVLMDPPLPLHPPMTPG